MRQLITRLDDDLHRRLKELAASEGKSMNALVTEALALRVAGADRRAAVRLRVEAAGLLFVPPVPGDSPGRTELLRATKGAGDTVSTALAAERAAR